MFDQVLRVAVCFALHSIMFDDCACSSTTDAAKRGSRIIAFCQDRLWTLSVITNRDFYECEFYLLARMIFKISYRFYIYSHFVSGNWAVLGERGMD